MDANRPADPSGFLAAQIGAGAAPAQQAAGGGKISAPPIEPSPLDARPSMASYFAYVDAVAAPVC